MSAACLGVANAFENLKCQEASTLSRETFIPCNRPACAVVWHERDGRAYLMCHECADHNVHNRRGRLLATSNLHLHEKYST